MLRVSFSSTPSAEISGPCRLFIVVVRLLPNILLCCIYFHTQNNDDQPPAQAVRGHVARRARGARRAAVAPAIPVGDRDVPRRVYGNRRNQRRNGRGGGAIVSYKLSFFLIFYLLISFNYDLICSKSP